MLSELGRNSKQQQPPNPANSRAIRSQLYRIFRAAVVSNAASQLVSLLVPHDDFKSMSVCSEAAVDVLWMLG